MFVWATHKTRVDTIYSCPPSCTFYRMPPSYVYGAPYLNAGAATTGLVPLQATQLSHAAAIAAATNQFYEYQNAVATAAAAQYPNQFTGTAGYDAYTYSPGTAAAVAGKKRSSPNIPRFSID